MKIAFLCLLACLFVIMLFLEIETLYYDGRISFVIKEFLHLFYSDLANNTDIFGFLLIVLSLFCIGIFLLNKLWRKRRVKIETSSKEEGDRMFYSSRPIIYNNVKEGESGNGDAKSEEFGDDQLGHYEIVEILSGSILDAMAQNVNLKIGIEGDYGTGKSSTIKSLIYKLRKEAQGLQLKVIEVNPWIFKGVDKFYKYFFDLIRERLKEFKGLDIEFKALTYFLNVASAKLFGLELSSFFVKDRSLEEIKSAIEKVLEKEGIKLLLIFYDLDRSEKEIIDKTLGIICNTLDFGNIIVVLEYNEKCLKEKVVDFDFEKMLDWKFPLVVDCGDVYQWFLDELINRNILQNKEISDMSYDELEYLKSESPINEVLKTYLTTMRKARNLLNDILSIYKRLEDSLSFLDLLLVALMKRDDIRIFYFFYNEFERQLGEFRKSISMRDDEPKKLVDVRIAGERFKKLVKENNLLCEKLSLYLNAFLGKPLFECKDGNISGKKEELSPVEQDLDKKDIMENFSGKFMLSLKTFFGFFIYFSAKEKTNQWFSKIELLSVLGKDEMHISKYLDEKLFVLKSDRIVRFLHFWYLLDNIFAIEPVQKAGIKRLLKVIWQRDKLSENFIHDFFREESSRIFKSQDIVDDFLREVENPFLLDGAFRNYLKLPDDERRSVLGEQNASNENRWLSGKKRLMKILNGPRCICEFGIDFGFLIEQKELLKGLFIDIDKPGFVASYLNALLIDNVHGGHGKSIIALIEESQDIHPGLKRIFEELEKLQNQ